MRLFILVLVVALLLTVPLLIFGDTFDQALDTPQAVARLRGLGGWGWLVGMGLIVADLVLPIPASAVMNALGMVYGAALGGLVSAAGSFLAGAIAFLITRRFGRRAAKFLAGERELARAAAFFERSGAWAVALSRPLPLLPEIVACLAGMAGMSARRFFAALACGSVPMGFVFATLGSLGSHRPLTAIVVSGLIPLLLWPISRRALAAKEPPPAKPLPERDHAPSAS